MISRPTHSQLPNNEILKKKLLQHSLRDKVYFLVNFKAAMADSSTSQYKKILQAHGVKKRKYWLVEVIENDCIVT